MSELLYRIWYTCLTYESKKKPAENNFFCNNGDYNQFMIDILQKKKS